MKRGGDNSKQESLRNDLIRLPPIEALVDEAKNETRFKTATLNPKPKALPAPPQNPLIEAVWSLIVGI